MSDEEIRRTYRLSKHPAKQIQILADLNCMKPDEIKKILGLAEEKGNFMEKRKWTPEESKTLTELRARGATAADIAKALGRSGPSVMSKIKHDDYLRRKVPTEAPMPEAPQPESIRFLDRETAFDIMAFFNSMDCLALADVNIDILNEAITAGYIANGQRYELTFAKQKSPSA